MPRTSKADEERPEANKIHSHVPCPVVGCDRKLALRAHDFKPGRLAAYCDCPRKKGQPVLETDAPAAPAKSSKEKEHD